MASTMSSSPLGPQLHSKLPLLLPAGCQELAQDPGQQGGALLFPELVLLMEEGAGTGVHLALLSSQVTSRASVCPSVR